MKQKGPEGAPSRRDVLRKLLGGALVGAGVLETAGSFKTRQEKALALLDDVGLENADTAIQYAQDLLQERYGIGAKVNYHSDELASSRPLSLEEAKNALRYLIVALGKYPPFFFKDNHLPEIRIGKEIKDNVSSEERDQSGLAGVAFTEEEVIVVEYAPEREVFENRLDHEIYHILDYRDRGYEADDHEWVRFHDEIRGVYGNVEELMRGEDSQRRWWFARPYGATDPVEDRASMAETILQPYSHHLLVMDLEYLQKEDLVSFDILFQKYESVKRNYFDWSRGVMNDKFWDMVIAQGRDMYRKEGGGTYEYDYDTYEYYYEENGVASSSSHSAPEK